MSALPRPDVTGPSRALNDALHDLHHRAGWPSLRTLARETGVSHTTVSKAFSQPALPTWGTVELLVEAMGGELPRFHDLWLAASGPFGEDRAPSPRIAGRRTELAAVRRHLETGTGLLLVTGEAGIGKTRLVTTAASYADAFVAVGRCLPLSTEVPLMPVADVLGQLLDVDQGRWLTQALAECPPFVGPALASLLPELVDDGGTAPTDVHTRHRMFTAAARLLEALAARRPLALLVEDLHWADPATLDLLETLLARSAGVSILATWRTEDQTTPATSTEWLARARRTTGFQGLSLAPLSREETVEQLTLLIGEAPETQLVERIHARSLGQPLFTEQLAHSGGSKDDLPAVLAELLDSRVARLSDAGWAIVRTLGVADRPLPVELLRRAASLSVSENTAALHELFQRRLVESTKADDVGLRHPLLAEAAQRRLVPGEGRVTHETLAEFLGTEPDASPAEVARHWQGAGDEARELDWRIAAARAAAATWASGSEAEQWLRAFEIWPESVALAGDPPILRPDVFLTAIDALKASLQFDRAAAMCDEAETLFSGVDTRVRAELLRRAADFRSDREGALVGLRLVDEAIDLFQTLPPSTGMLRAMDHKHVFLLQCGRSAEAFSLAREAARAAADLDDPVSHRHLLSRVSWHEGVNGSLASASETMARARALVPPGSDPPGDIWEAWMWTDVLLKCGASAEEVETAGLPALTVAADWEIETYGVHLVRFNVALALLRDGRVTDAASWVDPVTEERPNLDQGEMHFLRALLDATRGRLRPAQERASAVWRGFGPAATTALDYASIYATIELWNQAPGHALDLLLDPLDAAVDTGLPPWTLPGLVVAARAAADCAGDDITSATEMRETLAVLYRRARLGPSMQTHNRAARAQTASWAAELARLDGTETVRHWLAAVSEWDRINRPHDAAYCRWRAAQVALREGQGTVAARLLRRATTDAVEHAPLSRAIDATVATAP